MIQEFFNTIFVGKLHTGNSILDFFNRNLSWKFYEGMSRVTLILGHPQYKGQDN